MWADPHFFAADLSWWYTEAHFKWANTAVSYDPFEARVFIPFTHLAVKCIQALQLVVWSVTSCVDSFRRLGARLTSSWSCWNLSPISRSLRPICTSTFTPAWSSGLCATLSSSSLLPSPSSSSICLCPLSSIGSNWAGKCERNPALPRRKTSGFLKHMLLDFKDANIWIKACFSSVKPLWFPFLISR